MKKNKSLLYALSHKKYLIAGCISRFLLDIKKFTN